MINDYGSIETKVYHKETHTDQDLHINSNHTLELKRGVVKTLMHRVDNIVSDERDKVEVTRKQALNMYGHPDWLINSIPSIQPSLESTSLVMTIKQPSLYLEQGVEVASLGVSTED